MWTISGDDSAVFQDKHALRLSDGNEKLTASWCILLTATTKRDRRVGQFLLAVLSTSTSTIVALSDRCGQRIYIS